MTPGAAARLSHVAVGIDLSSRSRHRLLCRALLLPVRGLDGHVVPSSGEDVGTGGPPGAFVVRGGPAGMIKDRFDDAPFLLDGVLPCEGAQ